MVNWLGLLNLRLKFDLVSYAHCGESVWSFLLTVPPPSGHWIWSSLLTVPHCKQKIHHEKRAETQTGSKKDSGTAKGGRCRGSVKIEPGSLKTQSIKIIKKGDASPFFWAPLGPLHPLKKKEDRPQSILKKRGSSKKKGDEHFCVFWKQQNAFWNFIFKMKRTFSKNHEHPKIPRPGILSDLCRNFTLI